MISDVSRQTNPYKGNPPRSWLRIQLIGPDGRSREMDLLADTGSPCALIVSVDAMQEFKHQEGPGPIDSNFGPLNGGLLQVRIPELEFEQFILGYAGNTVVMAAESSSSDFEGLVGLPLLRMFHYGGDRDSFWIRSN